MHCHTDLAKGALSQRATNPVELGARLKQFAFRLEGDPKQFANPRDFLFEYLFFREFFGLLVLQINQLLRLLFLSVPRDLFYLNWSFEQTHTFLFLCRKPNC